MNIARVQQESEGSDKPTIIDYIPNGPYLKGVSRNKLRHAAKWPMDVTNGTDQPTYRLTDCRNC